MIKRFGAWDGACIQKEQLKLTCGFQHLRPGFDDSYTLHVWVVIGIGLNRKLRFGVSRTNQYSDVGIHNAPNLQVGKPLVYEFNQ